MMFFAMSKSKKVAKEDRVNLFSENDARRMVQAIIKLHQESAEIYNRYDNNPLPGSPAYKELNSFQKDGPVKDAYIQANLLIEGVADHLVAFTRTLIEPIATLASWTCTRACLESAALASWLLSPNIDARERVQRSFTFRYEGLSQQRKFAQAANLASVIQAVENRIILVEQDALQLGYQPILDRNRKRSGIGLNYPGITNLIRLTFNDEDTYRLMSAVVHGHTWATHQAGFQIVDNETELFLEKSANPDSVAFLCWKIAGYFAQPVWYKSQYFGWDCKEFESIVTLTFAEIGMKWEIPR
jgi:hypothetical protein